MTNEDTALGPGRAPKVPSNQEDTHGQQIQDAIERLNELISKGRDLSIKTRLSLNDAGDEVIPEECTWQPPRKVLWRKEKTEADDG